MAQGRLAPGRTPGTFGEPPSVFHEITMALVDRLKPGAGDYEDET
jgi:hypothetical protein